MKDVKRILSWLLCLALVIGIIPAFTLPTRAAEETITWNASVLGSTTKEFTTATVGDSLITLTGNKNGGSNAPAYNKAGQLRLYNKNQLVITPAAGIALVKVQFTTTGSDYGFDSNFSVSAGTFTTGTNTATIDNINGAASVTLTSAKSSQVRVTSITFTYTVSGSVCEHPEDKKEINQGDNDQHWYDCECGAQVDKEDHSYNNGFCECGKAEPAGTSYELVTNVSQLAAGDQVIIVAKDAAVALSNTEKSNNRPEIAITKNGNVVKVEEGSAVEIVTLEEGTTSGTFAFKTANGYLFAASSTSNYLRYEAEKTANSSWTIAIDADGVATVLAQGDNTRNYMQYNSGSSIFACYASDKPQADITIYELAGGEDTHDCVDTNPADHKCDTCGETVSECVDTTPKDHKCDTCGVTVGDPHVAAAGTHICAYCNQKVSDCADEDKNHNCDVCGEPVSECVDAEPKDHKCDVCGKDYGPDHADGDDENHTCDYCGGAVEGDVCVDGDDNDHNCDECGAPNISKHEYDNIYDANCNICNEEREVPERVDDLKNYATSLGGDIGFKMYFTLTEETLADEEAYVSFTIGGVEIERQYMTEAGEPDKDGEYAFMCGVAAAQMADEVTVQLVYSDGTVGDSGSYSVKDYVEQRLQNPEASAEEKALLKAMVNYGAYAQTFFGYNAGDLANDITGVELPDLNAVTAGQITQSNAQNGAATGIAIQGYSVLLEDETTFKFVFALEAGADIADYTFTYTDDTAAPVTLEAKKAADGTYCVYIEDIAAALLDQRYTLTVTHTDGTSYSLTTSVLCYVKSAINNANNTEAKVNMVKALYLYNEAANAYFNK